MLIKIAISGKFCSGKTTLANLIISFIKNKYPNINVIRLSFASEVKRIAKETFLMKEKNRNTLQSIGHKMREIDPDVFCKYVINQVNNINNNVDHLLILDDLRYENEMEYLKKNNFKLIRINITKSEQLKRINNLYPNDNYSIDSFVHESEIGLDHIPETKYDLFINNNNNESIIKDFINLNYNE